MAEITWIKLSIGLFDDEKIKIIEAMPDKDALLVIWIKLLIQAGKSNASGYLQLTDTIPYTDEMLAQVLNRPLNTIRLALSVFQKFGMIQIDKSAGIYLTNWSKYQNIETMDKVREQTRLRVAKHRLSKGLVPQQDNDSEAVTLQETLPSVTVTHIELEQELREENKNISSSSYAVADMKLPINENLAEISKIYSAEFGEVRQIMGDQLKDLAIHFPAHWFYEACLEAALSNAHSMRYIISILDRWDTKGFKAPKENFGQKKGNGNGANRGHSEPPGGRQSTNEELRASLDNVKG